MYHNAMRRNLQMKTRRGNRSRINRSLKKPNQGQRHISIHLLPFSGLRSFRKLAFRSFNSLVRKARLRTSQPRGWVPPWQRLSCPGPPHFGMKKVGKGFVWSSQYSVLNCQHPFWPPKPLSPPGQESFKNVRFTQLV